MVDLQLIQSKIYEIREQRVMLDFDLAQMYGTETKVLKQAVKRNIKRFPTDFMFELNKEEFEFLRSQFVTSNILLYSIQNENHREIALCYALQLDLTPWFPLHKVLPSLCLS